MLNKFRKLMDRVNRKYIGEEINKSELFITPKKDDGDHLSNFSKKKEKLDLLTEIMLNNLSKILPDSSFIVTDIENNIFISDSKGEDLYEQNNTIEEITETASGSRIFEIVQNVDSNSIDESMIDTEIVGKIRPFQFVKIIDKEIKVEKEVIVEKKIPVKVETPVVKTLNIGHRKITDKYKNIKKISMPIVFPAEFIEENMKESVDILLRESNLDSTSSRIINKVYRNIMGSPNSLGEIKLLNINPEEVPVYLVFCSNMSRYSFHVFDNGHNSFFLKLNSTSISRGEVLAFMNSNTIISSAPFIFVSVQLINGVMQLVIHDVVEVCLNTYSDYLVI
ncbi:hypothetical protein [Enterococcus italicus]|uniref:hypothetical protein n=1 Tax=Enterococcus italicus TaxID=246144 RepID=UPI0028A586C6|nr:hypothetical protein [Enterococcus italicus]